MAASISEWQEHCNLLERQATKMSEALENAKKEKYDDRDATDHEKELEGELLHDLMYQSS